MILNHRFWSFQVFLLPVLVFLSAGCIFVRVTEHRVRFNKDGTGEALLRLVDIRSDAETDSALVHDFNVLMTSFADKGPKEFEKTGRRIIRQQFLTRGDTLVAEIVYAFSGPEAIEGLRMDRDQMYVVIPEEREIVKTDGTVEAWTNNTQRVVWDRDDTRIAFVVREKVMPPTRSLAGLYRSLGR